MTRHVVSLNAGSSSIKFALFELDGQRIPLMLAVGQVEMLGERRHITVHDANSAPILEDKWSDAAGTAFHTEALRRVLAWRLDAFPDANVVAAGHRVVHGGIHYDSPVLVTDDVMQLSRNARFPSRRCTAAQHCGHPSGARGLAARAASRVFRHRLPSRASFRQ